MKAMRDAAVWPALHEGALRGRPKKNVHYVNIPGSGHFKFHFFFLSASDITHHLFTQPSRGGCVSSLSVLFVRLPAELHGSDFHETLWKDGPRATKETVTFCCGSGQRGTDIYVDVHNLVRIQIKI